MPDEQDATLDQLFPNLAPALHAMEGFGNPSARNDALRADPEHHGVTDEDIASYFNARLNGPSRTLPPVVPGQVSGGPTFRSGTTGAPPVGGMEDGPLGAQGNAENPTPATPPRQPNQPPDPSPPIQPAEMPQPFQTGDGEDGDDDQESGQGGQEAPSATEGRGPESAGEVGGESPPTQLPPPVTPATVDLGDGRQIPIERIQAYAEFDQRLAADPQLQALIQEYVTTGRVTPRGQATDATGGAERVGPQSAPPSPAPSPFDNPPEDYADDPAFMALWNAQRAGYEAQQAQLAQVAALQNQQYQQYAQEQQARNEQFANMGVQQFQSARPNLTAEEIANLRNVAVRLNVIPTLLSGIDPVTGGVTSTDPVAAVSRAMEIAYQTIPEYRARETTQATTDAAEQAKKDRQRRTKAGSLSGSSGSVPRSQPAPTTPEGNRQAMLQEVGAMLQGNWEGNQ